MARVCARQAHGPIHALLPYMNRYTFLGLAGICLVASVTGCAQESGANPVTDDSGEVKSSKKQPKVDEDVVGVWRSDNGSQVEIFVLRKDATYLHAWKAVEQSRSALATQREWGTFTADGVKGVFTPKEAPEGREVTEPMGFEYELNRVSLDDGSEDTFELILDRERGGAMLEGSERQRKVFHPDTSWCTAENDCEL